MKPSVCLLLKAFVGIAFVGWITAEEEEKVLVYSASCQLLEPGFDIATDNDIGKEIAETPTHCCSICEKKPGCRAWAWNIAGPTCYLKKETSIVKAKDSTTRAGLMGAIATCSIHKGFDVAPGNDLAWHRAETPTDCCGICAAIKECKAWTHNVYPPRCYLKTNTTLVPASDETTTAGIGMFRDAVEDNEIHDTVTTEGPTPSPVPAHSEGHEAGPAPI